MDTTTQNIKYYIITAIKKLNMIKVIENDIRYHDEILEFLGVEKFEDVMDINITPKKGLVDKNLEKLSKIIPLSKTQKEVLRFVFFLKTNDMLEEIMNVFKKVSFIQTKEILSKLLNIDKKKINDIFKPDSILIKSSLISIDFGYSRSFSDKIDILSDSFAEKMIYVDEDVFEFLKEYIQEASLSKLDLDDYKYIKDTKNILNYLKKYKKGINILLYGIPGTGKTEFAKLIANKLNKKLYLISEIDEDGEAANERERKKAYQIAQTILDKNSIILYDEAEDIFYKYHGFQDDKAWINRQLEENRVPTIWITNNINSIDDAVIRRFDYVLELKVPQKKYRKKIISKYVDVSKKTLKLLASHETLAPAIIERNVKVWRNCSNDEKELIRMINNTLKAQGYRTIIKHKKVKIKTKNNLPNFYNPEYVNTDVDLNHLLNGLKESPNANICMYGLPGTGKSAFGRYIAKKLKKEVILKKGSDLLSMWVGGTEQNIANAFREAKKKKAVLIFDEVDTFLQDRSSANRSWEISQVNEMLTQMEEFDGIFIATTNLMNNLDKASLRRFDIKMEFKELNSFQIEKMFLSVAKELDINVDKNILNKVKLLKRVSLGDFATIIRQNKFNKVISSEDFYNRLKYEIEIKNKEISPKIGLL